MSSSFQGHQRQRHGICRKQNHHLRTVKDLHVSDLSTSKPRFPLEPACVVSYWSDCATMGLRATQMRRIETMIDLTETAERKWCVTCEYWFVPRPCNAKKQRHCCKTGTCRLASKQASNRQWHRRKSVDPEWRQVNVLRTLRHRRIVRFGFDAESAHCLQRHLRELVAVVSKVVPLLAALKALLPAIILGKLPGPPVTLKMELESTCNRAASSSGKMILKLGTVPGLTLLDSDLPRCA
jgi:hypothetical protein